MFVVVFILANRVSTYVRQTCTNIFSVHVNIFTGSKSLLYIFVFWLFSCCTYIHIVFFGKVRTPRTPCSGCMYNLSPFCIIPYNL